MQRYFYPAVFTRRRWCHFGYGSNNSSSNLFVTARLYHSNTNDHQSGKGTSATSAEGLRKALRTLGLVEKNCTDAEIKRAFQSYAKKHHPDLAKEGVNDEGPTRSSDRIVEGTEAYRVLRSVSEAMRKKILENNDKNNYYRHSSNANYYTEEEYRRASKAYQGRASTAHAQKGDRDGFFDPRTNEGRRRIAFFNTRQAHVEKMQSSRKRGGVGSRNRTSTSNASSGRSLFGISLWYFATQIKQDIQQLLAYRQRWGSSFAGADGSAADCEANQARAGCGSNNSANPNVGDESHVRNYMLYKQRAQERALVDNSMKRLLALVIGVVLCICVVWLTSAVVMKRSAAKRALDVDGYINKAKSET